MGIFKNFKQEIIDVIPAVIYFCIAFNLVYFTTGIGLKPGEVRYFSYLTVSLFALIVGKVLIIVNHFSFINAFPNKPLIYNIIWKFIIYTICIIIAWIIEEFFHLSVKYDNVYDAYQQLGLDLTSPLFFSTLMWLCLIFLVFIVFHEFTQVIGKKKVMTILFGQKN